MRNRKFPCCGLMENLFSKGAPDIYIRTQFCNNSDLLSGLPMATLVLLSSKVNLLSGDIFIRDSVSSFRQIDKCALKRKSLIYSMRKVFWEHAVVELAYKFDENVYRKCRLQMQGN